MSLLVDERIWVDITESIRYNPLCVFSFPLSKPYLCYLGLSWDGRLRALQLLFIEVLIPGLCSEQHVASLYSFHLVFCSPSASLKCKSYRHTVILTHYGIFLILFYLRDFHTIWPVNTSPCLLYAYIGLTFYRWDIAT